MFRNGGSLIFKEKKLIWSLKNILGNGEKWTYSEDVVLGSPSFDALKEAGVEGEVVEW